jgi:hypothetical protein
LTSAFLSGNVRGHWNNNDVFSELLGFPSRKLLPKVPTGIFWKPNINHNNQLRFLTLAGFSLGIKEKKRRKTVFSRGIAAQGGSAFYGGVRRNQVATPEASSQASSLFPLESSACGYEHRGCESMFLLPFVAGKVRTNGGDGEFASSTCFPGWRRRSVVLGTTDSRSSQFLDSPALPCMWAYLAAILRSGLGPHVECSSPATGTKCVFPSSGVVGICLNDRDSRSFPLGEALKPCGGGALFESLAATPFAPNVLLH